MQAGMVGVGSGIAASINRPLAEEAKSSLPRPAVVFYPLVVEENLPQSEEEEGGSSC